MRMSLFLAVCFFVVGSSCWHNHAWSISAQELFLQANRAYEQYEYDKASNLYQQIPNKGWVVWYNLGNCAYHMNNYYDALVCWKRAFKQPGSDKTVCENAVARAQDKLGINRTSSSFLLTLYNTIRPWVNSVNLIGWQLLFLCIWYFMWIFAIKYSWVRKPVWALLGSLLVALLVGALALKYRIYIQKEGITPNKVTAVYAGPSQQFHLLQKLPAYTSCILKEERDDWFKVYAANSTGWILKTDINQI